MFFAFYFFFLLFLLPFMKDKEIGNIKNICIESVERKLGIRLLKFSSDIFKWNKNFHDKLQIFSLKCQELSENYCCHHLMKESYVCFQRIFNVPFEDTLLDSLSLYLYLVYNISFYSFHHYFHEPLNETKYKFSIAIHYVGNFNKDIIKKDNISRERINLLATIIFISQFQQRK